jgi:phage host-nuclease inhibitor protein Gam
MTEKATEQKAKAPEVHVKAAPKRTAKKAAQTKPKPKVDMTHLAEVSKEVSRLEALKADRLALIQKAAKDGATTKEISEAAGLSVPRLRQLLHK